MTPQPTPTHHEAPVSAGAFVCLKETMKNLTPGAQSGIHPETTPYLEAQLARELRLLRHEQRTANLIAWHGVIDSEDTAVEDLYSEIYERLELGRRR